MGFVNFYRFAFIVLLLVMSRSAFSATSWYPSYDAAYAAAGCGASGGTPYNYSICASGTYMNYQCNGNHYNGCRYGFLACSVTGQTRDTNGICSCPAGQEVYLNQCVAECPPDTVRLSDGSCSIPPPSCESINVNPSDMFARCKQTIPNEPQQCINSDNTVFNIVDCPTITCSDGSTVTYPAPCPVVECPSDFVLVDLGEGMGNSCIKPLPPDDTLGGVCFLTPGSDVPLCVDENNDSGCRYQDGEYVCMYGHDEPVPGSTCYQSDGRYYCLGSEPEIRETVTETPNPDGSVTRTLDRETNVEGDRPSYTTQICTADGTCTTVIKGGSESQQVASLKELEANTRAIKENTAKANEHLKDISDNLKETGEFGGEGPGNGAEPCVDESAPCFEGQAPGEDEVLYEKTDKTFQSLFEEFKADVQNVSLYAAINSAFLTSFSSCNCPVWDTDVSLLGASFHITFDQLCSETVLTKVLPFVSAVVGLLAALIAIKFAFL